MMSSPPDHARLREQLAAAGQEHIYTFYHTLATAERDRLDAQVASLDWSLIQELVETLVKRPRPCVRPGTLEPAPYFSHHPADRETEEKYRLARRRGEELLRQGKVAAFVVAGGQGTRLGCPGPKGTLRSRRCAESRFSNASLNSFGRGNHAAAAPRLFTL